MKRWSGFNDGEDRVAFETMGHRRSMKIRRGNGQRVTTRFAKCSPLNTMAVSFGGAIPCRCLWVLVQSSLFGDVAVFYI
ncbi:MAG: hypothetical protein VYA34_10745 [Myxococcota bacterium]|nr:hypothetical protein [Myxococcota bacterium]